MSEKQRSRKLTGEAASETSAMQEKVREAVLESKKGCKIVCLDICLSFTKRYANACAGFETAVVICELNSLSLVRQTADTTQTSRRTPGVCMGLAFRGEQLVHSQNSG